MNVTILLRILPDLGSKYSLLVDGERFGDMETLNDAIVVRDRLEDDDLTIAEAHVVLGARDKQERPVGLRELTAQRRMKLQPPKKREPHTCVASVLRWLLTSNRAGCRHKFVTITQS